jgi:hypothetical protein
MVDEELAALPHVVQLPVAAVYVQPPWIRMAAVFVGSVTCSALYEPLSR